MASKTLKKAQWLWQDYVGAKWQELHWANTGDDHASYVYPQGKGSKSSYRPKSLFYHYQVTGIDANKYKIDKVDFVIITGKFNKNSNPFPSIKVYYGDNNSPYNSKPIATDSSPTFLKNKYSFDSYTMQFSIKGLTVAQLKNIVIEVDWGRTKISGSSTISVNRARLNVTYSLQDPKWSLYQSIDRTSTTTNDKVAWKLTVKNAGYCSSNNTVKLTLPKGVSVISSSGGGSYNSSTKTWSFGQLCKGKSITRTFYLKSSSVGSKNLVATNSSNLVVNKKVTQAVNFTQYIPPVQPKDSITYTFYDEHSFEKEPYQYFDIHINGVKNKHIGEEYVCYELATSQNVDLYLPLRETAEMLGDNVNIAEMITDPSVAITDNTLCFRLDEINQDFNVNVRVYMYLLDDTVGNITTIQGDESWSKEFDIFPKRGIKFLTEESISRDKSFVPNSVNIGSPSMWTIRAKPSRYNFFDEKKELMELSIEDRIAYIGVIPLSRCHKADVTATAKNSLIENRYLNRAYYGKKGDYSEDIKMTLRIPWYDVATLEGLCEMDKPIPIDTIPNRADGDPLNHRGWAEIYEVSNIKKINDLYYECDVSVTYLTHNIITRFGITETAKITTQAIQHYLDLVHDWNDDILDVVRPNYYQNFVSLEDANGNMIGQYDLTAPQNLVLTSTNELNKYATWDFVFRNHLPVLMSEDFDKNWEMALKIVDTEDNSKTYFEHTYTNFNHYDFENNLAVNTADATTKYLNGNSYELLNYDKLSLGYDNIAPLIEDLKTATHFNTMETTVITDFDDKFEIFLLDDENHGIPNQVVTVNVNGIDGYSNQFKVITDLYGRVIFDVYWGNGDYTLTLQYNETEKYRPCSYTTDMNVNFNYVQYRFEYPINPSFIGTGSSFICSLLDSEGNGVPNTIVHYSFKTLDGEYGHEETITSDSSGQLSIPIKQNNGSQMIRVNFKGYRDGATIYQPLMFEEQINVYNNNKELTIEADNLTLVQGDNEKEYSVIFKDEGAVVSGLNVKFFFYNTDETFYNTTTTDEYGVARVPLYLKGGAWKVDIVYDGDDTYNPVCVSYEINVDNFEEYNTFIASENRVLNENKLLSGEQEYYTITLYDENDANVVGEPVSVKIYDNDMENIYIDTVFVTDENGKIVIPYMTHGENVVIQSIYHGSVKYHPTTNEDIVSFEDVPNKTTQILSKATEQVPETGTGTLKDQNYLELYINNVKQTSWHGTMDLAITSSEDNFRSTSYHPFTNSLVAEGELDYDSVIPKGTYNLTCFLKGDANRYSYCKTFSMIIVNPSIQTTTWWCNIQDVDFETAEMEYEVLDSSETKYVGDFAHIRFKLPYWIPNDTFVSVKSGYGTGGGGYVHEYYTTTKETLNEEGKRITYFDVYGRLTNEATWRCVINSSYVTRTLTYDVEIPVTSTTKSDVTVSQDGFAYDYETYQNIYTTISSSESMDYANDSFYLMKLFNLETYEELYYYSYLTDVFNPQFMTFKLPKSIKPSGDNWRLDIFVNDTPTLKCGYYTTTGRVDTDTDITEPQNTIIIDENNYTHLGSDYPFFSEETQSIRTSFDNWDTHSIMNMEFTSSNYYVLSFDFMLQGYESSFIIGSDPTLETLDGMFVTPRKIILYSDGEEIDKFNFDEPIFRQAPLQNTVRVQRNDNVITLFVNDTQIYKTDLLTWNTFGVYQANLSSQTEMQISNFKLEPYTVVDITPPVNQYDGSIFGSNWHLEVRNDHLNFIDYGMLPSGATGSGKVIVNDVPLPKDSSFELKTEITYNNGRFDRLNNLVGEIQVRVYEDMSSSDRVKDYQETLVAPMPVPNAKTIFTRHTEEGTMYFVKPNYLISDETGKTVQKPTYLVNAYNIYKGGCELYTETGISLFSLDNAHSPIICGNDLVRAEFHRRSGYIIISRYDDSSDTWYQANILKLENNLKLHIEEYNDDYVRLRFGGTTWEMYRGRPFIVVKHPNDDIRILNLVDRVYCETIANEQGMGFIEEHDTMCSVFNPRLSIQQFSQELRIGENIKTDNFLLHNVGANNYLEDLEQEANLSIVTRNNKNALMVTKGFASGKLALEFPSYSNYVKKPSDTFSLLLGSVESYGQTSITVKARGFDERGAVPVVDGIQYGIWEQSQDVTINGTGNNQEVRVTFTNCPTEVKYLDFVVYFNTNATSDIILQDLMFYEGADMEIKHQTDTSIHYANQVEIKFDETYYANIYDEDSPVGLCIIRPTQTPFSLRRINASNETVLAPYMKKCNEWDKPSQVFLEYLNAKRQTIDIEWSDF